MSQLEKEIIRVLQKSPVPEDYLHALNVQKWVKRLQPNAGGLLLFAALAHDIERALPDKKVNRKDFSSYDAFKKAHAENSARIMDEMMCSHGLSGSVIQRVCHLIRHHELGHAGDQELSILKDADSLSFFEVNLPHYYEREGEKETLRRMRWGFRRLSSRGKRYFQLIHYQDERLRELLQKTRQ